jgi:AraC family transcriptional regulator
MHKRRSAGVCEAGAMLTPFGNQAPASKTVSFDVFTAQYVRIDGTEQFGYTWCGSACYLALYDVRRSDGETQLDGQRSSKTDLRRKLTFVPPGCTVSGWAVPARALNSFTAIFIHPDRASKALGTRLQPSNWSPLLHFEDECLRSSLSKIDSLLSDEVPYDKLYAETLGLVAAFELSRLCNARLKGPPLQGALSKRQAGRVIDFVESSLQRGISLAELAELAGQSQFHFSRAFKMALGMSPVQYVMSRRIERARELLKLPHMTVAEVAAAVGFNGIGQFSRAFSRSMNMSPSEYRKSLR